MKQPADELYNDAAIREILAAVDFAENRRVKKYSTTEQLLRVLWILGEWTIRLSPRPMFAWRRFVLRLFGAKIGRHVHVYPTTSIRMPWNVVIGDWAAIGESVFIYSLGPVHIGPKVTVSYRSHICAGTHDFSDPSLPLVKAPVTIDEATWIGTDAFIGPGVHIGRACVISARAVILQKKIEPAAVMAGNPACRIGTRTPKGITRHDVRTTAD